MAMVASISGEMMMDTLEMLLMAQSPTRRLLAASPLQ